MDQSETTNNLLEQNKSSDQNTRVLNRVIDLVNKFPFSGKLATKPLTIDAASEHNLYYKSLKTAEAIGMLGILSLAHAGQAGIGGFLLYKNTERFLQNQSPENLLACAVDTAYIAVMCAATYAQVNLIERLGKSYLEKFNMLKPKLEEWGVKKDEVDYNQTGNKLIEAVSQDDQREIDTFFMILPKKEKLRVMEQVKQLRGVIDKSVPYDAVNRKIEEISADIEKKSRFNYVLDIVSHAHKLRNKVVPYSFKEQIKMLVVTFGGQAAFISTAVGPWLEAIQRSAH